MARRWYLPLSRIKVTTSLIGPADAFTCTYVRAT
jgi:hypothetical protein